MQVVDNNKEKLVLRLEANLSLANAIRRSVSEIPVLAVDEVEIFKNDSALYDEIIANRIGLIPLKTEKGMNAKTKVELKLSKKGPGVVYSGDFEGDAEVVYKNIPITLLGENHKIQTSQNANDIRSNNSNFQKKLQATSYKLQQHLEQGSNTQNTSQDFAFTDTY